MVKCTFCGKDEAAVRGVHVIFNDGGINYYCSSKCRKNSMVLRRDKRKLKWTKAYREERDKARLQEEKAKAPKTATANGESVLTANKKSNKQMNMR